MRYILFLTILFGGLAMHAQEVDFDTPAMNEWSDGDNLQTSADTQPMAFDYKQTKEWKRYKVYRAIGWSALGVGVPMTFVGLGLTGAIGAANGGEVNGGFAAMAVTGGLLTVASIPILINAYNDRSKAKRMALSFSTISTPSMSSGLTYQHQPALSVSITF